MCTATQMDCRDPRYAFASANHSVGSAEDHVLVKQVRRPPWSPKLAGSPPLQCADWVATEGCQNSLASEGPVGGQSGPIQL